MTETSPTSSVSSPRKARSSAGPGPPTTVRLHTKGLKRFHHPIVGELELSFNRLEVAADPGLIVVAYTAEPGSRSAETFALLASWAATEDTTNPARADPAAGHRVDRETK